MPWNSSKSDVNTKHQVFVVLHPWLVEVVKDYASLSRIWMGDWPDKVFKHDVGQFIDVKVPSFPTVKKSFLPPLPKSRPRYGEVIAERNKQVVKTKPWTRGLYEGVVAADLVAKHQRLEQRNRIALIVLDSTLEIAFKEYLVNESKVHYTDAQLAGIFGARHKVHLEIQKHVTTIKPSVWKKIAHYYGLRCKLIHERATVGVSDGQIEDFREVVEQILKKLYRLRFDK